MLPSYGVEDSRRFRDSMSFGYLVFLTIQILRIDDLKRKIVGNIIIFTWKILLLEFTILLLFSSAWTQHYFGQDQVPLSSRKKAISKVFSWQYIK